MWLGDDFHHNGAFRLSYGFEYAFMEEAAKTDSLFPFGQYDLYNWYLKLGSLSHVNENYFHNKIPTWNNYVAHPDYDLFWQKQGLASRLDSPRVQIMHVGGWWDQEDLYGPQAAYGLLEKNDLNHKNYFVAGPWNHGGWAHGKGDQLGSIKFGSATGTYFRENIQARWFRYHLKGKGEGKFAEATTFQTGSNTWKSYDSWPPAAADKKALYFREQGKLSFVQPEENSANHDSYVSDPAHPVPYRARPVEQTYGPGSRWYPWLTEDQRFVHNRPDVLSWETDQLDKDMTVTGNIIAQLFASTTASDADFIVKLIDVYPDEVPQDIHMGGYQLMVASEVFRARYRNSYEKPEPMVPGKTENITIDLHQINHVFQKGHRIMVQVQSTWFPLIDRNPQHYVKNIFEANDADFIPATHRIYRTATAASRVLLPVMNQ
jgi:putative CocE/NonD family hydrolase